MTVAMHRAIVYTYVADYSNNGMHAILMEELGVSGQG